MADIPLGRASVQKSSVIVAALKSFSLNFSSDKIDTSQFGSTTAKFEPGIKTITGSFTGFIDKDSTQQTAIRDAWEDGTHLTDLTFNIDSTSYWELDLVADSDGYILIDSYTVNTDNNNVVNFSANFAVSGAFKRTGFDT